MKRHFQLTLAALLLVSSSVSSAASLSNYLENKIIDWLVRGQTFTPPANLYVALATTAGSDAGCGTEVSAAGYARVEIASSLANWAGTQSSGSTIASSGTSGLTSNNIVAQFGAPTADWGQAVEFCVMDASTSGNTLWRAALTVPKTINNGDAAPSFAIGALTFQIDN